jgi:NADH:ubiquinone oxidoreductase subunit 3 (subunit A)
LFVVSTAAVISPRHLLLTVSESCDNAAVDGDVATSAAALHETAADAVFYSTNVLLILLDVSLSLCFTWAGPRPEQNNF